MDSLIGVAAKVCEYTVAPIGRQLGYLFFYKKNVEDLKIKIVDLRHVKESLQHEVEEAESDARGIKAGVNDWLAKADKIISEDHGNFTRHEEQANTKFTCGAKFPNLVLRHQLSRRARKMAETVATQIQKREKINQVSYRLNLRIPIINEGYENFESRNRTLTDVMEALRDPNVGLVGLWGMGGVGKTMLSKEVARRAMDDKEKLFTEVVFTAISKEQSIKDIQQDIGEKLGIDKFHEESKDVRAEKLRNQFSRKNKILIILDDIWDKLDLEDVGISFGGINQKGCKILLTTRYYRVLASGMRVDSKFIFDVGVLLEHEAMSLFRKIVGDQADKQELQGLASEIVKECGRLPIAITTVASALKVEPYGGWKNALQELRVCNPVNIDGMHEKVYTTIKFSYDYLKSVEAKHLLLLCSIFPEDAEIPIKLLCNYGFGLNLFEVNTLEEARNKTDALVTKLKDHSLLLDAYDVYGNVCVKLHDVIRDVVIYVATQIQDGNTLKQVSYRLNLPISVGNKGYEEFESRNQILTEVMEALRDPNVGLVGLVGMGGVGKTMLAKEAARRAMDDKENLFTKVVFTAISQQPNIKKIQQDIGEKLGMTFSEESTDERAEKLRNQFSRENKILIILDDLWDCLDLEDAGISFGGINQLGCKILLTTRSLHVCNRMKVGRNIATFVVGVLWEHEAMSLFRKIVGDQAEKQELQGLATEIVEECVGLPIAITTIASALKGEPYGAWKNALQELRKSDHIYMHEKVFTSMKLRYDYLKCVEAKRLLLLCSLFPEDAEIPIRVLCNYVFALNLFEDVNTLEEARNKTDALVTKLKDRSLLLDADDGFGNVCVKLHDLIRDVVRYVASELDDHH